MNLPAQFKEYLLNQGNASSKATVKNYLADLNKFIKWFETTFNKPFSADSVTGKVLENFKAESLTKYSASSVDRNLSSLRKFFQFAKSEGVISQSPFEARVEAEKDNDPWRLKDFKNNLYVFNASHLTIKNYIIDVKQFLSWAETVLEPGENTWETQEHASTKVDSRLIEEYKKRLLDELKLSPVSVNRKLSSLRRYLAWAKEEGIIRDDTQVPEQTRLNTPYVYPTVAREIATKSYSKFPPLRLIQKSNEAVLALVDSAVTHPLAQAWEKTEYAYWKLKGKPVTAKITRKAPKITNVPKSFYAPALVSTKYFPMHKKVWHHARNTRPQWYRQYRSYAITSYFHLAILIIFMSALGYGLFNWLSPDKQLPTFASVPTAPPRILSFQGRLTDNSDNPITATTQLRMAIYNNDTASGAALLWQEVITTTPDNDGIFSTLLGQGTSIPQSVFGENSSLWLGVTVLQTPELTPRQRLATVAYAANAETLQGLEPITNSANTSNVVLALNSSGNLSIGGSATPTFQATGGTFTVQGTTTVISTTTGSNGNVNIVPDGLGKIDLKKPLQNTSFNNNVLSAAGSVEVDDLFSVLATSSGQSAFTLNQDSTGPLISASTSGVAKFTVDNSGNTTAAGTINGLTIAGGTITSGTWQGSPIGPTYGGTGLNTSSSTGVPYISSGTWSVDANSLAANHGGTGQTSYTTGDLLYASGTTTLSKLAVGTGSQCLLGGTTPTWGSCTTGGYFTRTAGNLFPANLNDTLSATTSAATALTLTQTGAFDSLLVQDQANDTTPFVIDQSGNVGIGTTTPGATLDIQATYATTGFPLRVQSSGYYHALFQGTDANDQVSYYIENDRGSFNSYGGFLVGGSTSTLGNLFGQTRADKLFMFADGANNQGMFVGTLQSQPFVIGTNNTEVVRVTGAGNVGIGDSSPLSLLTVGTSDAFQINSSGVVTSGTWNGTAITDTYVADALTISGGTINNSPIGASTPSTGAFTTLSSTGNTTVGDTSGDTLTINAGSSGTGITFGHASFTTCGALETVGGVLTCGTDDGGTTAFSSITSGTNTTAAMVVGSGASLSFSGTGTITASSVNQNFSNTTGTGSTFNVTDTASSGTTSIKGVAIGLTGTNNASGTNKLIGVNFDNVAAATNNTYYAMNFGTGFNDILRYNDTTTVINGSGQLNLSSVTNTLAVTNGGTGLNTVAAGSILAANSLNTLSAITSTSGLKVLQNSAGTTSWATTTGTGSVVYNTSPTFSTALDASTSTFDLLNTPTSTINFGTSSSLIYIGPTSTGVTSVELAGGFGDTGCSVTGAAGNLSCDGAGTFGSGTFNGNVNMTDDLILNIGNSGTDFTAGGGLTLAGALLANGDTTLGDTGTDGVTVAGEIRGGSPLVFEGGTNDNIYTQFSFVDPTSSSKNITFPDANITVNAAADISGTTLASNVVTSSLTTVGALNAGSITSGFGAIDTGADSITTSGTIGTAATTTFTGGSATFSSGIFNGNVDMTDDLILNIGNAGTDFTSGGGLTLAGNLISNGNTTIGNANTDTLTINAGSSGTGIAFGDSSFATCTALETVGGLLTCGSDDIGTSWWTTSSDGKALTPVNSTMDFLLGETATTSAKFSVLNLNTGTPTASIAGNFITMPWTNGANQTGGLVGIGTTAPGSLLDINNRAGFNKATAFNITQANTNSANSTALNITNTVNRGSAAAGIIKNIYTSLTPTVTNIGGATVSIFGNDQDISLSNLTMNTSGGESISLVYGNNVEISGNPIFNDASDNDVSSIEIFGNRVASSNTLTLTNLSPANSARSYGGYFAASLTSAGDSTLDSTVIGLYVNSSGDLTTSGTTLHQGGYFDVSGTADNNYGLYLNSVASATNNYGLYINTVASGASNYAIYSNAAAQSYFAGKLGLGTTAPDKELEINAAAGGTLRLTYNDSNGSASTYSDLNINSSGNLVIAPTGNKILPNADNTVSLGASPSARFKDLFVGPSSLHVQCTTGDGCGVGTDYALGVNTTTGSFSIGANGTTPTGNPFLTVSPGGNVGIGDSTPASLFTVGTSDAFRINSSGVVTAGTWNGTAITDSFVADALTISGGTIDNSPIGATTKSTGGFTTLTSTGATTLGTGSSLTNTFGSGTASVNVIGSTSSPGTLTLHGATTLDNTFTVDNTAGTSLITLKATDTTNTYINFSISNTPKWLFYPAGTGNSDLRIWDTADRFTFQSGGKFGIGDTSPAALLTVGSGDLFQVDGSGNATLQNQGDLRLGDADGSNYVAFQSAATVGSNVTWTLPSADSSGCFQSNGSGTVTIGSCGGGGGAAFSAITSGTNTTAAMVVGTGATLDYTASGTINASSLIGATWASPAAIGSTSPAAGTFTTGTINSTLTLAANASISMTSGTGTFIQNYSGTTGTASTFNVTDSASSGTTTVKGVSVGITGTNNATGTNAITGIDFANVTAKTNNTYYGINFGTGLNDILRYNNTTTIINGSGQHNLAMVTGTLGVANGGTALSTVAAGSILAANSLDTLSAITSTSGLKVLQNSAGTTSWASTTGTTNVVYSTSPTLATSLDASTSTFNLLSTPTSTINFGVASSLIYVGPTSTGATSIELAGGFGDTGCSTAGATGNFSCDGTADFNGALKVGSTDAFQINSSGNVTNIGGTTHTIQNSSGALAIDSATTGAINIGTGANAKTITIGNATGATALAFNSGTGSQTHTSLATSGTAFSFVANSVNTGTGFALAGNALSTGTLATLSSTSTALSTGGLMSLDWSPGSATVATGDLLSLNVGANGTLGNIFNVKDAGSSIFSVSQAAVTANIPASFNAAGDVAVAYDLNFTNPTASYIKSAAPITIASGETFNSSNLTLQAYNQGNVIVDVGATAWNFVFGGRNAWGAAGTYYPTLTGTHADEWVMLHSPHIPYLANGTAGYNGTTAGARIRIAGNTSASNYWDVGVPSYGTANSFKIGNGTSSLFTLSTAGDVTFAGALSGITTLNTSGAITGPNVTSGSNPGHTHTAAAVTAGLFPAGGLYSFASSTNASTSYTTGTIQLREATYGSTSGFTPPHLAFHWAGVVASQISIESTGRISIINNPGTSYEDFIADEITANNTNGFYIAGQQILSMGTYTNLRANSNGWVEFLTSGGGHLAYLGGTGDLRLDNYLYPGRDDVGGASGDQSSWYIAGNGTYGLQSNTGFNAAAGLYDAGNRVYSASSVPNISTFPNNSGYYSSGSNASFGTLTATSTVTFSGLFSGAGNRYVCRNASNIIAESASACTTSSLRYKHDILDLNYGLDEIMQMRPVSFIYNDDPTAEGARTEKRIGFVAEEINNIIPEVVQYDSQGRPDTIDYPNLTSLNTRGIQQLYTKIASMEADLTITDAGNLNIIEQNPEQFVVTNASGKTYSRVAALSKLISGSIRTGIINANRITTDSLTVSADSVRIAGQSLSDYIVSVVNTAISNGTIQPGDGNITSPIAQLDEITPKSGKNLAIKLKTNDETSKLEIKNASGSAVASLDAAGNASFSGTVKSDELKTNEASVSGTLRAKKIIADEIEGLNIKASTLSAQYITNNYYTATQSAETATLSASLSNLTADTATFTQGLMSFGSSTFYDASVANRLFVGGQLSLADTSINVLGGNLEVQPLRVGGVSFEGDLVTIDTEGNLAVNGNASFAKDVEVKGRLAANIIAPIPGKNLIFDLPEGEYGSVDFKTGTQAASLSINNRGDLTASGSGSFGKLKVSLVAEAQALSSTEVVATGSAGVVTLKANKPEVTVNDTLVTENSLIYLTPIGDLAGESLYLLRQVPDRSFTVGLSNALPRDIKFNFLIIN